MNGPLRARWARLPAGVRDDAVHRARQHFPPGLASALSPGLASALPSGLPPGGSRPPQEWPQPLLSQYARYWRDGNRTAYEALAGALRDRAAEAVLAAAVTGSDADVDTAADGLQLLCEQSTWCWAAHESFATASRTVVPDPRQPYLDLGAAETVALLAWADLVLADRFDERVPGLRQRIRYEARRRVLEPFRTDRRWHWLHGRQHNWNPWIHGHVLAATLFLEPDPSTVDLVLDGLDTYLAAQPADGGCDEGFAYWWNGPARLAEALQLLDRVTGGLFGPWDLPVLAAMARYPRAVDLGGGWAINVGDGPARPDPAQPWHVLHRWGLDTAQPGVAAHAAARQSTLPVRAGLGRVVDGVIGGVISGVISGVIDAARTVDATDSAPPDPPSVVWFPDVQLFVRRDAGLTLAVKGGHNDENHNHNDVGSYIVAAGGVPAVIDLGQPTYTAISFTERRYEQWVTRSAWHNLPVIGGYEQSPGAGFAARSVTAERETFRADLAGAYPPEARCRHWWREIRLDRDRKAVVVSDRWDADGTVVLHHVLAGTPAELRPGSLVVRVPQPVHLAWDPVLGTGELEQQPVDDPLLRAVWGATVHRLVVTAHASAFELTVTRGGPG